MKNLIEKFFERIFKQTKSDLVKFELKNLNNRSKFFIENFDEICI